MLPILPLRVPGLLVPVLELALVLEPALAPTLAARGHWDHAAVYGWRGHAAGLEGANHAGRAAKYVVSNKQS